MTRPEPHLAAATPAARDRTAGCEDCRLAFAALDLDLNVLTSLLLVVAAMAARLHPDAFAEELQLEYGRLSWGDGVESANNGKATAELLAAWSSS